MNKPIILWFRQDLRLDDNPALKAAIDSGQPVLPLYILDDENAGEWAMGAASRWWLHHSLVSLDQSLDGGLCIMQGRAQDCLDTLIKATGAQGVYWNRCYEPWRIARDKEIKENLRAQGLDIQSFDGVLLYEPHRVLKDDGTPYKVFTPFYKNGCLGKVGQPREPLTTTKKINIFKYKESDIESLSLLPSINWDGGLAEEWKPGEDGAQERLERFLEDGIRGYKEGRNFPFKENVSRLSPHLHFGEISPHQAWHKAQGAMVAHGCEDDGATFLSELGWREFSHSLLYHFPALPKDNWNKKFDNFPWRDDEKALKAWQRGRTGYPIVDAGMRELWQTGYMHNRVRMIVGSFLVKNLMLHWHHGQDWFWDTLVDADLANNSASWQWIAGCGADAAPYFRIFNPVTQGQKFDPNGDYIRRFVPEVSEIPNKYIHCPWEAPDTILRETSIYLRQGYPMPIVDLKASRERALSAFKSLSQ